MDKIIESIRAELRANTDKKTQATAQNYFKERIKAYGVKTAVVNGIATKHWLEVHSLGKSEIFRLCEELLRSGYMEEAFLATAWLPKMVEQFASDDLEIFKFWIDHYVDNWAKCDSFCNHTVGDFVEKYPQSINEVVSWAKSDNRWLRRASAVSLILPARKGRFLKEVLEISTTLLCDKDDLVQKGYGWLLREAGKKHQKEIFNFVTCNKRAMGRTALRYAIEKMPANLKAEAMRKDWQTPTDTF